jgi:hypothetical protein
MEKIGEIPRGWHLKTLGNSLGIPTFFLRKGKAPSEIKSPLKIVTYSEKKQLVTANPILTRSTPWRKL